MRPLPALVAHYLAEWDSRGWANAYHSLIEMGPLVLPLLEARLRETRDDGLRAAGVDIARHMRDDAALPLFEAALADRSDRVWKAALDGLVSLGSPPAIAALQRAADACPEGTDEAEWRAWIDEAVSQAREWAVAAADPGAGPVPLRVLRHPRPASPRSDDRDGGNGD